MIRSSVLDICLTLGEAVDKYQNDRPSLKERKKKRKNVLAFRGLPRRVGCSALSTRPLKPLILRWVFTRHTYDDKTSRASRFLPCLLLDISALRHFHTLPPKKKKTAQPPFRWSHICLPPHCVSGTNSAHTLLFHPTTLAYQNKQYYPHLSFHGLLCSAWTVSSLFGLI